MNGKGKNIINNDFVSLTFIATCINSAQFNSTFHYVFTNIK